MVLRWIIVVVVVSIGIFIFLLIVLIHRFCFRGPKQPIQTSTTPSLQNGIAKLHHVTALHHQDNNINKRRTNYYVFRRGLSSKPLFNWADNPSLVIDAVENGWSRFAFTTYTSSPSVRSIRTSLLGACATGDGGGTETEVEISWEVCQGSADFIQKIRFNSGLKKIIKTSVIKSALPLPGPPLGNSSAFPQEAYFEITILSNEEDDLAGKVVKVINKAEGDKIKLIQESASEKSKLESLIHVTSSNSNSHGGGRGGKFEELRVRSGGDDGDDAVVLSVGLIAGGGGGSIPLKLPGSYPGSIGFNSNGSVYLDGIKLVCGSENDDRKKTNNVIGCGYNPSQKKVFFTVDSVLVHEIHCKSEAYGTPLYPTLAANNDIMVLVNFGQSVFKYAPANLQRTPNPCFIGALANSPALGYEDSRELFSMGRIDSQWLNRSTARTSTQYNGSVNKGGIDYDEVSEGDLFEIVLDSCGRSPHTIPL